MLFRIISDLFLWNTLVQTHKTYVIRYVFKCNMTAQRKWSPSVGIIAKSRHVLYYVLLLLFGNK